MQTFAHLLSRLFALPRGPWHVACGLFLSLGAVHAVEFFQPVRPPRRFETVAKGGESGQAPAQTRAAVLLAIKDGIEWVSLDVRRTKDGVHVLWPDENLDGRTTLKGKLRARNFVEIKDLDAGGWFAPRFASERIATLESILQILKKAINLRLRCIDVDPGILLTSVREVAMENQVLYSGAEEVLERIRKLDPRAPILIQWNGSSPMDALLMKHPTAVELRPADVSREIVQALAANGIKVYVETTGADNSPKTWDRLLEAGVHWIETETPEDLLAHDFHRRHPKPRVKISHHRGASWHAPENTLPAFKKSYSLGADFVELDVRTTRDGGLFLLHDGRLDRTTNGRGAIASMSSSEVRKLDAGSWFGRPFSGEPVPTLDAFLSTVDPEVWLYVDAKSIEPEKLVLALKKHGLLERAVVYQGRDYLMKLKAIQPKLKRMPPLGNANAIDGLVKDVAPYAFDASWRILSKELIDRCHRQGVKVFSDALGLHERIEDYQRAIGWGIDLIQTDAPLRVLRALDLMDR